MERKKAYDPMLRIIHAWNGLTIACLLGTAWLAELADKGASEKAVWQVHVYFGYALILGLLARLIWGWIGPSHARLSDFWHPRVWFAVIRERRLPSTRRWGHDPLAAGLYLIVYALIFFAAVSGIALAGIEHGLGPLASQLFDSVWLEPLFEEPHEIIAYLLLAFTVVHIAALIWHEARDGTPMAQSMVSGYQYRRISKEKGDIENEKP